MIENELSEESNVNDNGTDEDKQSWEKLVHNNKRTFVVNRLHSPSSVDERELYNAVKASELLRVASDDSICSDAKHGSAPVKYFEHDSLRGKLRRLFIRNASARLALTFFDLVIKILICVVYIVRVVLDDTSKYACAGSPCTDGSSPTSPGHINWYLILWVHRPLPLWIVECVFAVVTFFRALLKIYIAKGNRFEHFLRGSFILEVFSSLPYFATLCYPPLLQGLFVPSFLSCWSAKKALDRLLNDLHRSRQRFQTISQTLSQQVLVLTATLVCLIFTTICGVQHIQRSSGELNLSMFDSLYFVIVTFSTVGYGDVSPDIWPSQIFMLLMICIAFIFLPMQIQIIASTVIERSKAGGEYTEGRAAGNKHVVVCSRQLQMEAVMDFLLEFYAHPKLEEHIVVLLAADAMDYNMQIILKDPKWKNRVVYMRGSALKDTDLKRCRITEAEACFILAPRHIADKAKADHHTILRSWAVKDFAPKCKQYIQLFKPENKIHVKFAEHVVCEDEFKYALLANNCLYPGLSTLVSLIVHTSGGLYGKGCVEGSITSEGELATDHWQQTYGRHSGNEIYHIQLGRSSFFGRYEGKKFTEASADAHQRFGISLVAVLDTTVDEPHLQLNPGPEHILQSSDFCFYMSVTKEEYAKIQPDALTADSTKSSRSKNMERMAAELRRMLESEDEESDDGEEESVFNTITMQMRNEWATRVKSAAYSSPGAYSARDAPGDITPPPTYNRAMAGDSTLPSNAPRNPEIKKVFAMGAVDDQSELGSQDGADASQLDHVDGTDPPQHGQVLNRYTDMDQDESVFEAEDRQECGKFDPFTRERAGTLLPRHYLDFEEFVTGPPPVTLYVGSKRAVCHLMKEARHVCCLEWGTDCSHCKYKNSNDERWTHQLIILAAQHACNGIYNFIVPLRSQFIGMKSLCPIILLLEEEPDVMFLETLSLFPLVYYMIGKITSVDDLLKVGINKASHLVVVNRDCSNEKVEDVLADSETIVAVQTIFKLFPNANIITELTQASNMRFMHFRAHDEYSQKISDLERKLKSSMTSNLNHIFRLPFAAGQVFSASMLDTLLYQTFVKGYLITFVRLLLGIDAEENSGHLSSIRMKRTTVARYRTYGELYQGLCTTTGEIPIAMFRTDQPRTKSTAAASVNNNESPEAQSKGKQPPKKVSSTINMQSKHWKSHNPEREDISDLIRNRMKSLDLSAIDYCDVERKKNEIAYVILNPSPKRRLKTGDLVYVIQPSSMFAVPTRLNRWRQNNRSRPGRPASENDSDSEGNCGVRERAQSLIETENRVGFKE